MITCTDPACHCGGADCDAAAMLPGPLVPERGDPRFYALLDRLAAIHAAKSHDYATQANPLANFDAAATLGVRPYLGVLLRLSDKWARIQTFATEAKLLNESIEDAHLDSAAYHLIAILKLWDENPNP